MDQVLKQLQKENPSERILFDEKEMENLSLDKKNTSDRPTVRVHQDRYLKPVKPNQSMQKEMKTNLDSKRILETNRVLKG